MYRTTHVWAVVATSCVAVLSWTAFASAGQGLEEKQREEFNRAITAELAARDPDGAALFSQAAEAAKQQHFAEAADLYGRVLERDPWFSHATRRLSGVESERGNGDRAVALAREAFGADPSAVNEAALSVALLRKNGATQDDFETAYGHARNASGNAAADMFVVSVLCQASLSARQVTGLDACVAKVRVLDADSVATHYYSAIDHLEHEDTDEASVDLERAHALGLPDKVYAALRRTLEEAESPAARYGRIALRGLLGWLAVLAVLSAVGALLSRLTLTATTRVRTLAQDGRARGAEAALRHTYRVVLWLTGGFYYVSLPLVAVVVVVLGFGLVYLSVSAGAIPVKLVVIVGLFVMWSLMAVARAMTARGRDQDPGEPIDLNEHPKLGGVLREVAARLGTRPVDAVYVTPGTEIAVLERGGLVRQLRGKGRRCLVLGAGVLPGMRVRELKAILAHEYGHFVNADTGGGFALAVRRSLLTMAVHLARAGVASVVNPAWWFVRGFQSLFLRVSQGASRLQEVLADRWAAATYGSEAFSRGLSHVVAQTVRFNAHMSATLSEIVPAERGLRNVYSFEPGKPLDDKRLEEKVEEAMSRPSSPYDSHPRPVDRIALVERMAGAQAAESDDDDQDAWSLLASRDALEIRMTEVVRSNLAKRGVKLLEDTPQPQGSGAFVASP